MAFSKGVTSDSGKYLLVDGMNGKTVLTDGTTSEAAFKYHSGGFIELEPASGQYWYDWRASKLYRYNGGWVWLDAASEKRVAALFPTVYMYGKTRDKYYQGLSTDYTYTVATAKTLPAGNYFIENE